MSICSEQTGVTEDRKEGEDSKKSRKKDDEIRKASKRRRSKEVGVQ